MLSNSPPDQPLRQVNLALRVAAAALVTLAVEAAAPGSLAASNYRPLDESASNRDYRQRVPVRPRGRISMFDVDGEEGPGRRGQRPPGRREDWFFEDRPRTVRPEALHGRETPQLDRRYPATIPESAAPWREAPRRHGPWSWPTGDEAPPDRIAPRHGAGSNELSERVARRYANVEFVELGYALSAEQALAMYLETMAMIDARHLEPADHATICQAGLRSLAHALRSPAFQAAVRLRLVPGQLENFEQRLAAQLAGWPSGSALDPAATLQLAMTAAQRDLGLPPGIVAVEFACAAVEVHDAYSAFVPSRENDAMNRQIDAELVGIGVQIQGHTQGAQILGIVPGGAAQRAGLQAGDVIVAVNGQPLAGAGIERATRMLQGAENSLVTLEVARGGRGAARYTLPRGKIAVQSVSDVALVDPAAGVAYMKLGTFAARSATEVEQALASLTQQGMRSLVLDLRGDPGGLLSTAVQIADLFLPQGIIVITRGRTPGDNTAERARHERTWKVPLVLLVDHESASASEILAAAIQENGRGVVVGSRTYGKGTVQTLIPLQSVPAAVRLTTARFYSPSGRPMADHGVTPDIAVDSHGRTTATDEALATAIEVARRGG